jgi:hypothetical protein
VTEVHKHKTVAIDGTVPIAGPQGPVGPQGPTGPSGPVGPQGSVNYGSALALFASSLFPYPDTSSYPETYEPVLPYPILISLIPGPKGDKGDDGKDGENAENVVYQTVYTNAFSTCP